MYLELELFIKDYNRYLKSFTFEQTKDNYQIETLTWNSEIILDIISVSKRILNNYTNI